MQPAAQVGKAVFVFEVTALVMTATQVFHRHGVLISQRQRARMQPARAAAFGPRRPPVAHQPDANSQHRQDEGGSENRDHHRM